MAFYFMTNYASVAAFTGYLSIRPNLVKAISQEHLDSNLE